ncbi:MAG: hypothetical protein DFNUSKGM_001797 [Candidatus Fervidibacter sacchari]|jgi:hypothetical protein
MNFAMAKLTSQTSHHLWREPFSLIQNHLCHPLQSVLLLAFPRDGLEMGLSDRVAYKFLQPLYPRTFSPEKIRQRCWHEFESLVALIVLA